MPTTNPYALSDESQASDSLPPTRTNADTRSEKTSVQEDQQLKRWLFDDIENNTMFKSARAAAIVPLRTTGEDRKEQCLIVSDLLKKGVVSRVKKTECEKLNVLQVDTELFEKDISDAFLGDLVAFTMLLPYRPIVGQEYLEQQDRLFKKRIILEAINSLVLEFGSAASELIIDPLYFPLEKIKKIAAFHPMMKIEVTRFLTQEKLSAGLDSAFAGFSEVITELNREQVLQSVDGGLRIRRDHVNAVLSNIVAPRTILRGIDRTARRYITEGLSKYADPVDVLRNVSGSIGRQLKRRGRHPFIELDPEKHIFFKTASGKRPLSPEISVEEMAARLGLFRDASGVRTTRLSGVLNAVFAMKSSESTVIAKKYNDWSNLKWFPLSIWAIGVRDFALLGKNRMANEYTFNRYLQREGFSVPEIYDIAWKQRVILQEYVEGSELSKSVRKALGKSAQPKDYELIERSATTIAQIHQRQVGLGDCKPENMISKGTGEIYLIDLEQAEFGGDPSWDIAQFLFYSSRYVLRPKNVEELCERFIEGYLEAGSETTIKAAASARYLSIFAPVTTLPVMIRIVAELRKANKT